MIALHYYTDDDLKSIKIVDSLINLLFQASFHCVGVLGLNADIKTPFISSFIDTLALFEGILFISPCLILETVCNTLQVKKVLDTTERRKKKDFSVFYSFLGGGGIFRHQACFFLLFCCNANYEELFPLVSMMPSAEPLLIHATPT